MPSKIVTIILLVIIFTVPSLSSSAEISFTKQGEYLVIRSDSKCGLFREDGKKIIPQQFSGISPVQNGYCITEDSTGYLGLWSLEGGCLLPCMYSDIEILKTRIIVRQEDGFCQLYDPDTGMMTSGLWDNINYHGRIGYYIVTLYDFDEDREKYGVINDDGNMIVPCEYDYIEASENGLYLAIDNCGLCTFFSLDGTGPVFLDKQFNYATPFVDGYALVENLADGSGFYAIDCQGNRVSQKVEYVSESFGGAAFAYKEDDSWYLYKIRDDGRSEIIQILHDCLRAPYYVGMNCFVIPTIEGSYVFRLDDNQEIFISDVSRVAEFVNDSSVLYDGINIKGFVLSDYSVRIIDDDKLCDADLTGATYFIDDYAMIRVNQMWYPVNREGCITWDTKFLNASLDSTGTLFIVTTTDGIVEYLDPDLKVITVYQYPAHEIL